MTHQVYANKYLEHELEEIQDRGKYFLHSQLNIYEAAIIFKYSFDGYLKVNAKLRLSKGRNTTNFGKLLSQSLEKLSNYNSIVFRKVLLTKPQQNIYSRAFKLGVIVKEYSFLSTTKVKSLAMLIPGNTLFIINSRTGKDIEKMAKFGFGSSYNEYEVLFQPNRRFEILEIDDSTGNLLIITMEEI